MVRVLQISGNMNMGGQETFIMNVYRNVDRSKIQFDFVVHSKERGYYDDEIEKLGGRIYRITPMTKNIFKHCKELKNVIKKGKYEIVHRHTSSSIVFIDLLIAKICGVKKRIVHSHNNLSKNVILHKIFRPFLNLLSTDKMACSIEAAKWLFGNKYCKCAEVVNNGVELTKFLFNKEIRNLIRKKYDVEDNIIIGHVGRFDYQKNHNYILKIFSKVIEKNDKYRLWLVGEGAIKEEIKQKAKEENIEKYIKFFGIVDNVNELLQGMDIFVFPSIYEGLGISLVEAQISGLKCIVSENIQNEAIITNNVKMIKLEQDNLWCKEIEEIQNGYNRQIKIDDKVDSFNIKKVAENLERNYLEE